MKSNQLIKFIIVTCLATTSLTALATTDTNTPSVNKQMFKDASYRAAVKTSRKDQVKQTEQATTQAKQTKPVSGQTTQEKPAATGAATESNPNSAAQKTTAEGQPQQALSEQASSDASTQELFDLISEQTSQQGVTEGTGEGEAVTQPKDPLSGYNHFVFKLNDKMDKYIAKPAARLYTKIVPRPLANMINNFYDNLENIPTVANDLLQANFYQATSDSWRFLINSTVGIAGTFDVAADMGLPYNYEDFGLTMAQWGWTSSSYFIIPILGPSTIRDALGRPVNYEMSFFPYVHPDSSRWALYILFLLNQRVQFLKAQELYETAAIDPYTFMRNAYLQRRAYLIKRNKELNNPYTAKDMKKYYDPNYLYE